MKYDKIANKFIVTQKNNIDHLIDTWLLENKVNVISIGFSSAGKTETTSSLYSNNTTIGTKIFFSALITYIKQ